MNTAEFVDRIVSHPQLHPGTGPRDDRIYIVYLGPDTVCLNWELEPAAIRENAWEQLEQVLTGRRRAEIMSHVTRIVGYYSNMRNWNPSKRAEARDRQRGEYGVTEPPAPATKGVA